MIKIILVEDEILIRNGIENSIDWEVLGYELVGKASSGTEGLKLALETNAEVILTDIRMPGMNGIEMSERIRERNPYARIVFISGYSDFSYAVSAIHLEAVDYILKPVDISELSRILKNLAQKINSNVINLHIQSNEDANNPQLAVSNVIVQRAIEYVNSHVCESLQVQDIANALKITPNYLSRLFREEVGDNLIRWITRYKILMAKKLLLENPEMRIYEAADRVGYSDYKYFIYIFKKYTGMTPENFRKENFNSTAKAEKED